MTCHPRFRRRRSAWLCPLVLAALSSCDQSSSRVPRSFALLPTVALDDRVAYVETNFHQVFLLDPADQALSPRIVSVGKDPVLAAKRNNNNQLLVLSQGDAGSKEVVPEAAELALISADAKVVRYPLNARFDGLAQSDDGRIAILYHSAEGSTSAGSTFYNPNELAIVHLDAPPTSEATAPNPFPKSIRSYGGVPTGIVFSPSLSILGETRTLAVIIAQGYVTILDLSHAARSEITTPLSDTSRSFMPAQVLFDAGNPHIYVRATGSNDIFQISFSPPGDPNPGPLANDFRISLSMLAAGSSPADMALYGTGSQTRLAVAAEGSKELVIIDPSTSRNTNISTTFAVNRLVLFQEANRDVPSKPYDRALLLGLNNGSSTAVFAALNDIENQRGLAFVDYPLGSPAASVVPLVDQGIAVVGLNSDSRTAGLTVVELATRNFSPIGGALPVKNLVFETWNESRLWSVDAQDYTGLSYLNLVARASGAPRLSTGTVWLDQGIRNILPLRLASSSDGIRYLVVEHYDPQSIGSVTVLNADNPDRAGARSAYGFLFTNYLERGQP